MLNFTKQTMCGTGLLTIGLLLASCGGGGGSSTPAATGTTTTAGTTTTTTTTTTATNAVPVANAGTAQTVKAGTLVTLAGSGTDADPADVLTYAWTLTTQPTGSTAVLSSSTAASPTFTPALGGSYVATLIVSDGKASSPAATVAITVTSKTKLNATGTALADTANSWSCVKDNVTNLVWETKISSGLHSYTLTYTNLNATDIGYGAATDAAGFVTAVNLAGLCGKNDWRLPTLAELSTLASPAVAPNITFIDHNYFPDVESSGDYNAGIFWTSDAAPDSADAVVYDFELNLADVSNRLLEPGAPTAELPGAIRLVRTGP